MRLFSGTCLSIYLVFVLLISACSNNPGSAEEVARIPSVSPDYTGVTIPPNIAPLNFRINEPGESHRVTIKSEKTQKSFTVNSSDGRVIFPENKWKELCIESADSRLKVEIISQKEGKSFRYEPFYMTIAAEKIDPYLAYRLIYPGYYSWSHIRIMQRCLENFREDAVVDNQVLDNNCVNCHSFNNNDPGRFMVHIRGSKGGTYIVDNGNIEKTDPKIETMPGSATYPSWHPGGRYIAFSSNQVRQSFYAATQKSIEVYDIMSSMIVYDRQTRMIRTVQEDDTASCMRTFPSWSPDGRYLYYCKANCRNPGSNPEMETIRNIHYNLVRKSFNADSGTFGKTEIVFNAGSMNKSASFPRISPDGKKLVFTLHDFGTFPIWHPEADLYLLDLESMECRKMELNSSSTESYHSWSHNGSWIVFSSKRADGRSTRPYFSYINADGKAGKPFMLPQEDPDMYGRMLESFNIPELVSGRIMMTPRNFEKVSDNAAIKSVPADKSGPVPGTVKPTTGYTGRPVHE